MEKMTLQLALTDDRWHGGVRLGYTAGKENRKLQ